MSTNHHTRRPLLGLALVALAGCASLAGCSTSGYMSWPPISGGDSDVSGLNGPPGYLVEIEALRWTTEHYPPVADRQMGEIYHAPFAINLPRGTSAQIYQTVAQRLGDDAHPLTEETDKLPTYHIARLYIRGADATVDVIVPALALGETPSGNTVYRGVTLRLKGGQHPWEVISHTSFPVGVLSVPEKNYIPRALDTQPAPPTPTPAGEGPGGEGT